MNEVSSLLVYRFHAPQPVLSPTQVHLAGTWEEVLKVFSDPAFDVRRDVALSTPIGFQLRPALSTTLTAVDGRLRVDVDTDGPSLVVLPIHFSTCWRTTSIDSPQLLNANGGFVGFVAPKSTSVMLEFGLSVWNSKCRRDDLVYWRQQAANDTAPGLVCGAIVFWSGLPASGRGCLRPDGIEGQMVSDGLPLMNLSDGRWARFRTTAVALIPIASYRAPSFLPGGFLLPPTGIICSIGLPSLHRRRLKKS